MFRSPGVSRLEVLLTWTQIERQVLAHGMGQTDGSFGCVHSV